jgi:hypothetical protein
MGKGKDGMKGEGLMGIYFLIFAQGVGQWWGDQINL